jgi:fused signal recognition particle receptor
MMAALLKNATIIFFSFSSLLDMFKFLKGNKEKSSEKESIAPPKADTTPTVEKDKLNIVQRLKAGLQRTRANFTQGLANIFLGKKTIDAELLEELESQLLLADVGSSATQQIITDLTKKVARNQLSNIEDLMKALQTDLTDLLLPCEIPLPNLLEHKPFIILMVGINGAGKTTTIGKLAKRFQAEGKSVMLAAGDTFRAAAVEQLQIWGERNSIPVIAQHTGADSASVIYDALQAAKARGIDVLIADTAGRLHTQNNLIEELKKIRRIINRFDTHAPHETLLVLDAATGQNALQQAKQFNDAIGISGIVLTKLDGTAKGGMIFAVAKQLGLPIRFIGIGESIDDLKPFSANEFVSALLAPQEDNR